ncbi:hypothetical protein L1987_79647 [Smallanthus sonchifolius]|uniref:Uncharacterized protein n=1 Tax=Smallanthus sonchifolius TaxID=185202 RepID=A0ACB8YKN8_9ASTR|nr:hypothetical protein L1987_79647 [Smallanthus sonchifolius]
MGDAVFDKAPDEEETEDIEEIEEELDVEEAHVMTREDDLDTFNNLSRKHDEQIPGDCSCLGCFLHFLEEDDDGGFLVLLFMLCVYMFLEFILVLRTFSGFAGYEIVNDVYNRLVEVGNEEATANPEFREPITC